MPTIDPELLSRAVARGLISAAQAEGRAGQAGASSEEEATGQSEVIGHEAGPALLSGCLARTWPERVSPRRWFL